MNKQLIFEYMEWRFNCPYLLEIQWCNSGDCSKCENRHHLDGNDMVAAMNKMVEKGEWEDFDSFLFKAVIRKQLHSKNFKSSDFIPWLFQPPRFFELISDWLERR